MNKCIFFTLIMLSFYGFSQSDGSIKIDLEPEKWDFQEDKVKFMEYKGRKAVRLDQTSGEMMYKDLIFENGTIEFDVELDQPGPFPAIYFRVQPQNAEHVYLRTMVANKPNSGNAVQYASIIDRVNLWDLQYEYQSSAHIKIGDWNHIKVIVNGKQLRVFVNDSPTPNLEVPCMEGNTSTGSIGISTGFPGVAIFSNITVNKDQTEGLAPYAGSDIAAHDTRYLRNWQISDPIPLPVGQEVNNSMLPDENATWNHIAPERRGLINLSRRYGLSESRRMAWLRTELISDLDQILEMALGFSDEVWVFVNRQPVYLDKNLYIQNMRKTPNGRISLENSSFNIHLKEGTNEILVAIANDFYGWGIMARLEHLNGINY